MEGEHDDRNVHAKNRCLYLINVTRNVRVIYRKPSNIFVKVKPNISNKLALTLGIY